MSDVPAREARLPESEFKAELLRRKSELQRPEATSKCQYLALIEKNWFKALATWMNCKKAVFSGPIANHLLCSDGKIDPSKRYRRDFAVVSDSMYDLLFAYFRGGPKIVRPYVLVPGSDQPDFILAPIPISVRFGARVLRKTVDGKWTLGMIRGQLCRALDVARRRSRFTNAASGEVLGDALEVAECGAVDLALEVDYLRVSRSGFSCCERVDAPYLTLVPVQFAVGVYFVSRVPGLAAGFLRADAGVAACVRRLIERLLAKGERGAVDCREFLAAVEPRVFDGRGDDPADFLRILLRETDASAVNVLTNRECPFCQAFSDSQHDALTLDVPLPLIATERVLLTDCIAGFSMPEKMKESEKVECPKCRRAVAAYETRIIHSVADVLVIQVKRWVGADPFPRFVDEPVEYPHEIDVASFASKSQGTYRLRAVIFWNLKTRPSVACWDEDLDRWIFFQEGTVFTIDSASLSQEDVYVLGYQRVV
jgi:hypothetical protein